MACWQWQDDRQQWQSYDDFTAVQMEKVYTERTGTVILFVCQNWHYEFDLRVMANMTQTNLGIGKVREMKREELSLTGVCMCVRARVCLRAFACVRACVRACVHIRMYINFLVII